MKKSFILHLDSLVILDEMTDEQAGKFLKSIYQYQKTSKLPELNFAMKMAITPFINQFIRDEENYEKTCQARRIAGSKGGKQKVANASNCKQSVANLADNKNDNKNDSKSDNDSNNNKKESNKRKNYAEEMKAIWNATCVALPPIRILNDTRKRKMNELIGSLKIKDPEGNPLFEDISDWQFICEEIQKSPFLCGENDRGWRADIDFCLQKSNLIKIYEGKYDSKK